MYALSIANTEIYPRFLGGGGGRISSKRWSRRITDGSLNLNTER